MRSSSVFIELVTWCMESTNLECQRFNPGFDMAPCGKASINAFFGSQVFLACSETPASEQRCCSFPL